MTCGSKPPRPSKVSGTRVNSTSGLQGMGYTHTCAPHTHTHTHTQCLYIYIYVYLAPPIICVATLNAELKIYSEYPLMDLLWLFVLLLLVAS